VSVEDNILVEVALAEARRPSRENQRSWGLRLLVERLAVALEIALANSHSEKWGIYCLDGPAEGMWCGIPRIETDRRTAETIAPMFHDRSVVDGVHGGYRYEARRLP
jgi:hypothetical protein